MTTPQMDWLDDERRRSRNATPKLVENPDGK